MPARIWRPPCVPARHRDSRLSGAAVQRLPLETETLSRRNAVPHRILNIRLTAAIAVAVFGAAPLAANAQGMTQGAYRVLIDGTPAGSAATVANLPTQRVAMTQDSNPTLPSKQVASSEQASVTIMTADPNLVSAIQAWMAANNSGSKDTVQPKTVEIDRMSGTAPATRYRLKGAWPTKLDSVGNESVITIVYQTLEPVT